MTRDNIPQVAEEIIIEQQTVQELREQIINLQKTKEKLEKELEEEKKEKEQIQKELEKEKGWWDKWMEDPEDSVISEGEVYLENSEKRADNILLKSHLAKVMFIDEVQRDFGVKVNAFSVSVGVDFFGLSNWTRSEFPNPLYNIRAKDAKEGKQMIKHISEYYKWLYDDK